LQLSLCLWVFAAALLLISPVRVLANDAEVEMPPMPGQAYHPPAQSSADKPLAEMAPELKKIDEQIRHEASILQGGGMQATEDVGQKQIPVTAVGQAVQTPESAGSQPGVSGHGGETPAPSTAATRTDSAIGRTMQPTAVPVAADPSAKAATAQSQIPQDKDADQENHAGLILLIAAAVAMTLFLLRKYFSH
jgi:hypothetical protein